MARFVSAREAAELLGVKAATLYAYVSRGLIRSEPGEGKDRRYLLEDIRRVKEKNEQRRDPARGAKTALEWGTPVLDSAITLIDDGKLYYRGLDACELALTRSFEEVAELLWTGAFPGSEASPGRNTGDAAKLPFVFESPTPTHGFERPSIQAMQHLMISASTSDIAAYQLESGAARSAGRNIVELLVRKLSGEKLDSKSAAQRLALSWTTTGDTTQAAKLINAALILSADHELNASAFAVRVAASAGSNPYQAVVAGLATIQGVRHGGDTERVSELLEQCEAQGNVDKVIGDRLRRGERIPGFGHRLYPEGDPRAKTLLDLLITYMPESPAGVMSGQLRETVYDLISIRPNVDFALATLERACALPYGAALLLFALGRTAGWIGHIVEQYESANLIRPRARYTGPAIRNRK